MVSSSNQTLNKFNTQPEKKKKKKKSAYKEELERLYKLGIVEPVEGHTD